MNITSGVLCAVLGALYLPGTAIASDLAFLGPKGSYSDEAASKYVSRAHQDSTTALTTITEIAQSVGERRVQLGLLPFENSIGGLVGETQKLLLAPQNPEWRVIADVTIPISNNLLVKPGAKPSDLRKIVSHPEALKECANWRGPTSPSLFRRV
jgi:prephenate dehydratase